MAEQGWEKEEIPSDVTQRESPKARQAWMDYFALGPNRSLSRLAQYYEEQRAKGVPIPTNTQRCLERWSRAFRWQDRVAQAMFETHEKFMEKTADERAKYSEQRLNEARMLHTAGGAVVQEIIKRVQAGELAKLAFAGYWTQMSYETETIDQDWKACPAPACITSPAAVGMPDPDCPQCGGKGRLLLGTGRRKLQSGTKVIKIDGLMDFAGIVARMIDTGQKLERTELGEGRDRSQELLDAVLAQLPEPFRSELAVGVAQALTAAKAGGGGS